MSITSAQMITLPSSPAPAPTSASSAAHRLYPPPPPFLTSSHSPHLLSHSTTRRSSLLLLLPLAVSPTPPTTAAIPSPATLDLYTDTVEGFSLLKPASWVKVDKAGATALFEEEGKGSNSIGVVVNPVRLSSLRDFGTPEFVADKLIQAERRKESTKNAEVIAVSERLSHGGLPVYEFEYSLDSTRGGMKKIFSAAFVAYKKLYLLNIAYSDGPENPLDIKTRMILEQVLHSFDTTS